MSRMMMQGGSHGKSIIVIEGVASTINTKALFASYFDFEDTNIETIDVDVALNKVTANVNKGKVSTNDFAFNENVIITGFYFTGKKIVLKKNTFRLCANLLTFVAHGNCEPQGAAFAGCTKLDPSKIVFDGGVRLYYCSQTFAKIRNISEFIDLSMVNEIITPDQVQNAFDQLSLPIINLSNCETIICNNDVSAVNYKRLFQGFNGTINLYSLTTLQWNPNMVTGIFGTHTTTMRINVNIAMATANDGRPHAELVDAIMRGANVNYI